MSAPDDYPNEQPWEPDPDWDPEATEPEPGSVYDAPGENDDTVVSTESIQPSKGSQDYLVLGAEAIAHMPKIPGIVGRMALRYASARRAMIDGDDQFSRWLRAKTEAAEVSLGEQQTSLDQAKGRLAEMLVQRAAEKIVRRNSKLVHRQHDRALSDASGAVDTASFNMFLDGNAVVADASKVVETHRKKVARFYR